MTLVKVLHIYHAFKVWIRFTNKWEFKINHKSNDVVISKETLNLTTNVSNTIGINIPTVNTTTNFPQKNSRQLRCKTRPLNSYTVATLPAAVLNDEATVTDATSDAALTGGGTLTIPVWYNGTAWTKLGGGSGGSTTVVSG
jgi:hypothetical protein